MKHHIKGISPETIVAIVADFLYADKLKSGQHVLSHEQVCDMVASAQREANGCSFDVRFSGETGICLRFSDDTVEEIFQHDAMLSNAGLSPIYRSYYSFVLNKFDYL